MTAAVTSIRMLVASAGNEFMLDIARLFAEGFSANGVPCTVAVDEAPADFSPGHLDVVVAPHEYGPLFLERRRRIDAGAPLRHAFVLNVEQPGSSWFELACRYARRAAGILDISPNGVREFRRRGLTACHAPLPYAPSLRADELVAIAARPIDILFLGHRSPRREAFLSRFADFFSRYRCRFILVDVHEPRRDGSPGYVSGTHRNQLLASSKIVLNVHASDRDYFEMHRALLALANECLFVSESSAGTAPLVPGEHFVMAPLDDLPSLCALHLDQPDRLASLAASASRFLRERHTAAEVCRALLPLLRDVRARPPARAVALTPAAEDTSARRAAVIRRLELSRARRAAGQPTWDACPSARCAQSVTPSVSVVITLYNYADHVAESLLSVARAETATLPGGVELVVVDDASTDDSVDVVERFMKETDLPVLLVRKHMNTGLADARNIGLALARAPYVFILDADNWIFPSCLAVLHRALDQSDAAAAYGLISTFDDATGERTGLLSIYDWSVPLLLRAPYIDAMALLRRDVVLRVGGYATELIDHGWFGWEDYDLWLTLAQAGHRAILVPEIVASYRQHAGSMIHVTNRTTESLARYFHRKFRPLIAQHPELDQYFGLPRVLGGLGPPAAADIPPPDVQQRLHHQELQRQLEAVYASLSWRVTAPLRLAYRLLTGRP
ncbi:MAG TPA: glycosyltransferase family 2 protein [Candidatus Tectomicrobia bacterium]|nr:glycosyltransferase family 2 protein [Candidatus Tectomicrobia bacterium]